MNNEDVADVEAYFNSDQNGVFDPEHPGQLRGRLEPAP